MDNDKLPIKFFAKREVDELRVEAGGSSDIPNWVLKGEVLRQHANKLYQSFLQFYESIEKRENQNYAVPFVFTAKLHADATSKSRRSYVSALFQVGSDKSNIIGLTASDELLVKIDSISQMNKITTKLKDYDNNNYAISCLETFLKFEPEINNTANDYIYKIKLIDFQDYETNLAIQRLFEQELNSKGIDYKKSNYTDILPIYKVNMASNIILDAFQENDIVEMLFSIEPMPKYSISLDSLQNKGSFDVLKPSNEKHYEILGILDTGIASIPQLTPWLSEERWTVYPESDIDTTHGTFVAGVALYGDICNGTQWVGHSGIKLFDAAVFPKSSSMLDEDELINNIREVVEANYKKVKVWNLSISVTRPISDKKFSDFAIALDYLQSRYNILICKSAGNSTNFITGHPKGRINEGADSVMSLVIGSVAHEKGHNDFSEIDNPSPFSCIGPGPEYIIKPEVSHYGGNAGINKEKKLTKTGVTSFAKDGSLSQSIGTSFSTPLVASLATGLYQELDEDFDALLLKCLIIHSASYSEHLIIPEEERTNQLGFGVPKTISQILYNTPHEATLILRDTLEKGEKIDIMDFPMPHSLIRNGYYTGQIIVTLVYNPILDSTQGIEYCQSNINIKFGTFDSKESRDISKRNILNPIGRGNAKNLLHNSLYSKRMMKESSSNFALQERLLIQYADKYYPVKKYAVDLAELTESSKNNYTKADKLWYLYLEGLYREHTELKSKQNRITPSQDFCLIITIRDSEYKANVYDEVTQGLETHNFWHSNIRISNNLSVSVDHSK